MLGLSGVGSREGKGDREHATIRGGTQQSFIRGGSAPGSKSLPFYIPFLIEKVSLSYTFHRKMYPFHKPTSDFYQELLLLLNFSLDHEDPFKCLDDSAVRCVCSRFLKVSFINT